MIKAMKISMFCFFAGFALSGCATSKPVLQGQLSTDFGSAVKANVDMHAVAPTAAQKANTFIPADPTRTRQARQNYRENKIQEPKRVDSTSN